MKESLIPINTDLYSQIWDIQLVQTVQSGNPEQVQMGKAHTISNQDQGTDMDIEITKNSIRSRIGKNSGEAGVKIFK